MKFYMRVNTRKFIVSFIPNSYLMYFLFLLMRERAQHKIIQIG